MFLQSLLFKAEDIPWGDLAFPSGSMALKFFLKHRNDHAVDVQTITVMPPRDGPLA